MRTPRARARRAVRSMEASSPAWPPQAMLAEVTYRISAASSRASSSSPMSQLRSRIIRGPGAGERGVSGLHQSIQPLLLLAQQVQRLLDGDALETHFVARAQLAEAPKIGRDDVGGFGIPSGGLVLDEENNGLAIRRHLDGPQRHALGEHVARRTGNCRAAQADAHAVGFLGHLIGGSV